MKATKSAFGVFVSFQFVSFRNADKAVRSAQKQNLRNKDGGNWSIRDQRFREQRGENQKEVGIREIAAIVSRRRIYLSVIDYRMVLIVLIPMLPRCSGTRPLIPLLFAYEGSSMKFPLSLLSSTNFLFSYFFLFSKKSVLGLLPRISYMFLVNFTR